MNKVVYNSGYGGFSLSRKAAERLAELGDEKARQELIDHDDPKNYADMTPEQREAFQHLCSDSFCRDVVRHDPRVVRVVEELGDECRGRYSNPKIATIAGNRYRIDEYDGSESVVEPNDEEWTVIAAASDPVAAALADAAQQRIAEMKK